MENALNLLNKEGCSETNSFKSELLTMKLYFCSQKKCYIYFHEKRPK